jgi:RNA polymerase sigma factor (sigma-70 family)
VRSAAPLPNVQAEVRDEAARRLDAIGTVYQRRFPAFLRVASAILGDSDRGRDAVQEAFARALSRRLDYRGDGSLEAWLWRTVVNVACNHRRYRHRLESSLDLVEVVQAAPASADTDVRKLVATLPERQRIALFLRYYADLDYEQIADVMGVRSGTVGAALHSALASLRARLAEGR